MYIVMIDLPNSLKDFLTLKFLSEGFEIYDGKNPKTVQNIVETKGKGYLLVSINQLNSKWFEFLIHQRTYKDDKDLHIIVLSSKNDKEFIQTLLFLVVRGLIPANLTPDDIFGRLLKLVQGSETQNEKREYQRVSPTPADNLSMNLPIPNTDTILSGEVINISIGGVALQLANTGESKWMSDGMLIERTQMRINGKIGITGIKVVAIKGQVIGCRFYRPTDYFLSLLGRYLLDRLSGV
ncbi:MAG: PilZ domain-containing protein [Spirochaetota bacterium]|nr:PilZ domain-containing protein [Spirochaetota bacterium]